MGIRSNKALADRLVGEVEAERRARREHIARAKNIFGRRVGSPAGLAVCFGAGAVTGLRLGRGPASRATYRRPEEADGEGEEGGFLQRMTDSPLGNIVMRLAAATLVRYVLTPSSHADGADGPDIGGPGPENMGGAA